MAICESETPATSSSGSINFLEWLTDKCFTYWIFNKPAGLLKKDLTQEQEKDRPEYVGRSSELSCPLPAQHAPTSPRHVFTNAEALRTLFFFLHSISFKCLLSNCCEYIIQLSFYIDHVFRSLAKFTY